MKITISDTFNNEALQYANMSKSFTSDRHDFHEGGLSAKQRKMYEGKLGEKAVKQFFINNNIKFKEDSTSHEIADNYDFLVIDDLGKELKVDVKTRTKDFHTRTLEMVEQMTKNPKEIYISVRLYDGKPITVDLIGYAFKEDFILINRIENNGYLDNYVLYDKELKKMDSLINKLQKNG
jgi:hypothetical protein